MASKPYGMELVLDIHYCNTSNFSRRGLKRYFRELCDLIDMKRGKLTWWDYFWVPRFLRTKNPKLYGTSAVQFIMTSNITIHSLPMMERIYVNIFSCKEFDPEVAAEFTANYFQGVVLSQRNIVRW